MEQKKFMDIERLKDKYVDGFHKGDYIVVQEKIDGANFSIRYNEEEDAIVSFSRKNFLNYENNLRGAWNWAQKLDKELVKEVLGTNLILFGEWLCLSGDTVIKKTSGGKNTNYMTLRKMYEYSKTPLKEKYYWKTKDGKKHNGVHDRGVSWWEKYGYPSLFSLDFKTDKIIANQMIGIVYSGDKEVYEVKTRKGYSIKSTLEHPFLTPYGFKKLKEIKPLDCVAVTSLINAGRQSRSYGKGTKQIKKAQDEYKNKIGQCEKCGNKTCLELHHIDGNHENNKEENWMILCSDCHKKLQGSTFKGFEYDYEFDYITEINYVGVEDCYDITMSGDEDTANFVANGFIVHNCSHTIVYPDDKYQNAYFYDVYDIESKKYLEQSKVKEIVNQLGLIYVPVFYEGEFISWEHLKEFVGRTDLGGENGEGIVVKNMTRLNDPNTRLPFYTKIVGDKFAEKKSVKKFDSKKVEEKAKLQAIVESVVTEGRVAKLVHKMVDEGIIPEDWDEHNMGTIAKNIGREVYYDCVKEEPETVEQVGESFGKLANGVAMRIVRGMLNA